MCGIAGIFTPERLTSPEDVVAVGRMMDAQIHRGPDGSGMHRDTKAVLGHRRLAIIDLSDAGRQPMSNEDGTIWVTYNGEIYNFLELREDLSRRGHHFKAKTDTEVLVHGYEEWGIEELLARLRGMFAFGLYDARSSDAGPCLILAKDRFGIKPLYYSYQNCGQLIFASEVQALMKTGMVADEKDPAALVRFLQLGSVPVPLTTIKGVFALPAGHYALVDDQGFHLRQYWDLSTSLPFSLHARADLPLEQAVRETRGLLDESVKGHLLSDVPLGVFLSGGLDSSALVAVASRFREKPLTTVSIVFDEPEYSEAQYSRMVAGRYHTDHREILLRSKDLVEAVHGIFAAMDQPTVDGVNTFLVSKAAKEAGLTVVLSGTGADEVFLGYSHFKKAQTWERAWRLFSGAPVAIRKGLVALAASVGALGGRTGFEKIRYLDNPCDESLYLLFRGLFSPRQIQELLGIGENEFERLAPRSSTGPPEPRSLIDALALLEFHYYLQNQLLKDTDVMSMAWSIETRVPFLDHQLVEHVARLSTRMKIQSRVNKPALVTAVRDYLPKEIWDRPKMGFTFPFACWLKDQAAVVEGECRGQNVLDTKAVARVWKDFRQNRVHWSRPWALVVATQQGHSFGGMGTVRGTA